METLNCKLEELAFSLNTCYSLPDTASIKEIKADAGDSSDAGEKKPMKALIPAAAEARREALCTPEHRITDSSPSEAVPLHPPSFASSPSVDMALAEVSLA